MPGVLSMDRGLPIILQTDHGLYLYIVNNFLSMNICCFMFFLKQIQKQNTKHIFILIYELWLLYSKVLIIA